MEGDRTITDAPVSRERPVPTSVPTPAHGVTPQRRSVSQESASLTASIVPCFRASMPSAYPLITSRPVRTRHRASRRTSRYADQLLPFIAFHRTVIASHVERMFPHVFRTDRATRMHLQTLVTTGDLACMRTSVTEPNVYVITTKGLRTVDDNPDVNGVVPVRRHRPTGSHVAHELLITEVAVSLAEAVGVRPDLTMPWHERFGFIQHPAFRRLIPDYGFLLQHAQGRLACFVEVFSGEESPTRIPDVHRGRGCAHRGAADPHCESRERLAGR
jgi:hypothetical protein